MLIKINNLDWIIIIWIKKKITLKIILVSCNNCTNYSNFFELLQFKDLGFKKKFYSKVSELEYARWFFFFFPPFLLVKQVVIFAWRGFTVIPVSTFERVGLAVRLEAFTRMEIGLESYNCTGSRSSCCSSVITTTDFSRYRFSCVNRHWARYWAIICLEYTYRQFLCNVLYKVKLSHDNK